MSDLERVIDYSASFLPHFDHAQRLCVITLTNAGYVPMTLNMVRSLGRCGYPTQGVTIICLNEPSLEAVKAAGPEFSPVLMERDVCRRQARYNTPKFAAIMRTKVEAIRAALDLGRDVVYIDGDVVWLRGGGLHYMAGTARPTGERPKPVFQADAFGGERAEKCAGLLLAPQCPESLEVYDLDALPPEPSPKFDDQKWLNRRLREDGLWGSVRSLPAPLFMSGMWLRGRMTTKAALEQSGAYCVHLNWLVGREKERMLTRLDLWMDKD